MRVSSGTHAHKSEDSTDKVWFQLVFQQSSHYPSQSVTETVIELLNTIGAQQE